MAKAYRLGALASALALVAAGSPAAAQGVPQRPSTPGGVMRPATPIAQPVVQPIPGKDGLALDAALGRLARDPRDVDALVDAGNAALVMGDVDAATGFFRRADQVAPGNPRVKAGLAGAMVHNGDPFGAIPLFDEAEKAGALDSALAADRGLAYDLVGDNLTAQRYYRQSLARMPSDEAVRRLSLSYAIAGDKHNAELILSPLLSQRNLAAWRTRAFALAILGQTEEAVSIANTILPSELATGVAPYLRYMPRLTKAQQAAAANFGAFPRASEIGRDDPRVAQYAPKRTAVAAAEAALSPQGEPLGRKGRSRDRNRNRAQTAAMTPAPAPSTALPPAVASQTRTVRVAPPEPLPTRETGVAAAPVAAPVRTAQAPISAPVRTVQASIPTPTPAPAAPARQAPPASAAALPPATPMPSQIAMAPTPTPMPAPVRTPPAAAVQTALIPAPGFTLAPSTPQPAPAAAPPPTPAPAPAPTPKPAAKSEPAPVPRSLADAFAEFDRPSTDATPAAGAVDLRRIKPAKPEAKKPPEPPKPTHPSRIWVQLATGRDKAALGYDWRRMAREKADVLRGKAPFISAWGHTTRLLTGPFQSETAANSFIAQLRRADIDGAFVWTSPTGQVVDALPAATARR